MKRNAKAEMDNDSKKTYRWTVAGVMVMILAIIATWAITKHYSDRSIDESKKSRYEQSKLASKPELEIIGDTLVIDRDSLSLDIKFNTDFDKYLVDFRKAVNEGRKIGKIKVPNLRWYQTPVLKQCMVPFVAKIKNIEKSTGLADILMLGAVATNIDTLEILRRGILENDELPDMKTELLRFPMQLRAGQDTSFAIPVDIQMTGTNTFVHFMALYQNEAGCLYDVYYIIKYTITIPIPDSRMDIQYDESKRSFILNPQYKKDNMIVEIYRTSITRNSHSYTFEESTKIKAMFGIVAE